MCLAEEAREFAEDVLFRGAVFGGVTAAESEYLAEWESISVAESFVECLFVFAAVVEVVFGGEVWVVFDCDGSEPDFSGLVFGGRGCGCGCGCGRSELSQESGDECEEAEVVVHRVAPGFGNWGVRRASGRRGEEEWVHR